MELYGRGQEISLNNCLISKSEIPRHIDNHHIFTLAPIPGKDFSNDEYICTGFVFQDESQEGDLATTHNCIPVATDTDAQPGHHDPDHPEDHDHAPNKYPQKIKAHAAHRLDINLNLNAILSINYLKIITNSNLNSPGYDKKMLSLVNFQIVFQKLETK